MSITPLARIIIPICAFILLVSGETVSIAADQTRISPGGLELRKVFEALQPQPNFDTKPVEFSVGGIWYRMPRNYLTTMDSWVGGPQQLVTLKVNFPEFSPLTEKNRACFFAKPFSQPPGCVPITFDIEQPNITASDEGFANSHRNLTPTSGPYGYEKYEVGPKEARIQIFRKRTATHTSVYYCIASDPTTIDASCRTYTRATTGSVIHFFFRRSQLGYVEKINSGLRKLIEGFAIQKGHENDPANAEPEHTKFDQYRDQPRPWSK